MISFPGYDKNSTWFNATIIKVFSWSMRHVLKLIKSRKKKYVWIFEPQASRGILDPHGDTDNYVDPKGYIYVLLIYGVIYITAIDMTIYQFIHIKLPEAPWQGPLLHPSLHYFPVTKIAMPDD